MDAETRAADGIEDSLTGDDIDLVSQMEDMSINKNRDESLETEVKKSVLNLKNPVFEEKLESSKIIKVVEKLKDIKSKSRSTGEMEKVVIVSQWTSMLQIVKIHVEKLGLRCVEINGE